MRSPIPRKFLLILITCIMLLALLLTACEPYTVEGTIVGKVYEPAHAEQSIIPAGKVIVPLTNQVGDKWYVEISFMDKNNQQKIFYWGVAKEAYENYKIGDKTPVNVDDSAANGGQFVIFALLGLGVVLVTVKLFRWMFERVGESRNSRQVKEVANGKMMVDASADKFKSKLFW